MPTPKDKLNKMMADLSDLELAEIVDFAEFVKHKRQTELEESLKNAPVDDEALTPEEIESIKQGEEDLKNENLVDAEEVWKKLGL